MLTVLDPFDENQAFPPLESALRQPNGLLAVGGCLSPVRLENAYRHGIFPWFSDDEPILWWSPNPRLVLPPERVKISRSLAKRLRRGEFGFTFDRCFERVVERCARSRPGSQGTWITGPMRAAYAELHRRGRAHSVEAWQDEQLVGGLYGVAIGRIFFGESMFHQVTDASKAAFVHACLRLAEWGYVLIDCQVYTKHLASLGAFEIDRSEFSQILAAARDEAVDPRAWLTTDLAL